MNELVAQVFAGLVVAAVSGLCGYLIRPRGRRGPMEPREPLPGTPLAALSCYPCVADASGRIRLDEDLLREAAELLTRDKNVLGASDLVYLVDRNVDSLRLEGATKAAMDAMRRKYRRELEHAGGHDRQRQILREEFCPIAEGFGETFAGTPVEVVLHDARNPLHSIVSIHNPITGRQTDGPISDLGLRIIKSYAVRGSVSTKVGYQLPPIGGRNIKGSTIPLLHEGLGLVGFICINIDREKFKDASAKELREICDKLAAVPLGHEVERLFPTNEEDSSDEGS